VLRTPAPLKGALDCANSVVACPTTCEVPTGSMLERCRAAKAYVDCYKASCERPASFAGFVEAFYSSPIFKLERGILGLVLSKGASDEDARALAENRNQRFAIWKVEERNETEILLSTGRTRSWLMVGPPTEPNGLGVTLFFGSAVFPPSRSGSGMGLPFNALLGFHKLYPKALLASAVSRLPDIQAQARAGTGDPH